MSLCARCKRKNAIYGEDYCARCERQREREFDMSCGLKPQLVVIRPDMSRKTVEMLLTEAFG